MRTLILISTLFILSCHTPKDCLYEESKYLEGGSIRNVKYWIDKKGNVVIEIDTIK